MTYDFSPIREALKRSQDEGVSIEFWWRDDDAISVTSELERLITLAQNTGIRSRLAVIPGRVDPELPEWLENKPVEVLVHGWTHENTAQVGQKKSEFSEHSVRTLEKLAAAYDRMDTLFGAKMRPVFVPPWNRISPDLFGDLRPLGYAGLSTFGPRNSPFHESGILFVNTHVDPIFWCGDRDLVPPDELIQSTARLISHQTQSGNVEAIGLLTHHLVHSERIWDFSEAWLSEMLEGGGVPYELELTT